MWLCTFSYTLAPHQAKSPESRGFGSVCFPIQFCLAPPARRFWVHNDIFAYAFPYEIVQRLRRSDFRYTTTPSCTFYHIKLFRASGEAILGTQRYLHVHVTILFSAPPARRFQVHNDIFMYVLPYEIFQRLRRGDFRYTTILYQSTLHKQFIKALYTSTLSKHFTQHFIKARQTSTLSKHLIHALYRGISKSIFEIPVKVLQRY